MVYTTICLPEFFEVKRKNNQRGIIILHHDNASCAHRTKQLSIWQVKNQLMVRPPYSPDLTSNDLFLFPSVKIALRGQQFSMPEEEVDAFKMHILEVPSIRMEKALRKLVQTYANV